MIVFKLVSANDLRLVSRRKKTWEITGFDPHFQLVPHRSGPLPAGRYWIKADGGEGLDALIGAEIYIDTGAGFNENEKQPVGFVDKAGSGFVGVLHISKAARHLRFDPSNTGQRVQFSLRGLALEAMETRHVSQTSIGSSRIKLLINMVRLLPSHGGAGGAGRLCLAMLAYLPEQMDVRCAIPPYHSGLMALYPDVDFYICRADDNANLAQHLAWCDCYLDPLNALRPKTISPEIPVIGMVLDLQHMKMPWLFSAEELSARRSEYGYAISRSNHLIAISHYERENLQEFYGRTDVTVVHLSGFMAEAVMEQQGQVLPKPNSTSREGPPADRPYLIYPAVPWPHKNHEGLLQAIAILKRRDVEVPVILTNTSGSSQGAARIARLIPMLALDEIIDRKSFLPESELHTLFQKAAGLVFPSLYEGFGIPLVDAMKLGVPVLTAKTSAAAEVGGEACAYFSNIENVLAVADDIEHFWTDARLRTRLVEQGRRRGQDFSSNKMVGALADAIRAAIAARTEAGGLTESSREIRPPLFSNLAVLVVIDSSSSADLNDLISADDINEFLASKTGTDDVSLCVDLRLLNNPELSQCLRKAHRLTCYDGAEIGALDFAIQEFDIRYNRGECFVVFDFDVLHRTSASSIRAMYDLLCLEAEANAARMQPGLQDSQLLEVPAEIEGVMQYEKWRRNHYSVRNVMFKRAAMKDLKNGTPDFLSYFATQCRVALVPC